MAISYLMLSAIRIYVLETVEEIDADSKYENVKGITVCYFSPKIIFCILVFAIKCKDSRRETSNFCEGFLIFRRHKQLCPHYATTVHG
jgi:hypothetical protein